MSKDIATMKKTSAMLDLVHKSKGSLIAPREVIQAIEVLAPEAVVTLEELMRTSKADSVRLKAALEILGLAGISRETKITLKTEVHDMDEKEINSRLSDLLGEAQEVVFEEIINETVTEETKEEELTSEQAS